MSLITRCPACETMFKVVPDQLRVSEGWVRCGQCDEVFDASLHLLQASADGEMQAVPSEEPVPTHDVTDSSVAAFEPEDQRGEMGPAQQREGPQDSPAEPEQDELAEAGDDQEHEHAVPAPLLVSAASTAQLSNALDMADIAQDDSIEMREVSFLRDEKQDTVSKPLVRVFLGLLAFVLLLGLCGQIVFHERDRIAASEPSLKPWVRAFCEPLHCTVAPLRRIESIVIESSSFTKIRGDSYRLNFTVKNTAASGLAVPAIELTLTDSRDQPVVRRVLYPSELGAKSDTLSADSEWPTSLAMAVAASSTADRVAGYRLLAFYP